MPYWIPWLKMKAFEALCVRPVVSWFVNADNPLRYRLAAVLVIGAYNASWDYYATLSLPLTQFPGGLIGDEEGGCYAKAQGYESRNDD